MADDEKQVNFSAEQTAKLAEIRKQVASGQKSEYFPGQKDKNRLEFAKYLKPKIKGQEFENIPLKDPKLSQDVEDFLKKAGEKPSVFEPEQIDEITAEDFRKEILDLKERIQQKLMKDQQSIIKFTLVPVGETKSTPKKYFRELKIDNGLLRLDFKIGDADDGNLSAHFDQTIFFPDKRSSFEDFISVNKNGDISLIRRGYDAMEGKQISENFEITQDPSKRDLNSPGILQAFYRAKNILNLYLSTP